MMLFHNANGVFGYISFPTFFWVHQKATTTAAASTAACWVSMVGSVNPFKFIIMHALYNTDYNGFWCLFASALCAGCRLMNHLINLISDVLTFILCVYAVYY